MAITEDVKIRVAADTANARDGFTKLQATIVTFNQSLNLSRKAINLFKDGWSFIEEGAKFETFATKVNQAHVDKIQKATDGTVSRMKIMQEVSKKGVDAVHEQMKAQTALMSDTEKTLKRAGAEWDNFW